MQIILCSKSDLKRHAIEDAISRLGSAGAFRAEDSRIILHPGSSEVQEQPFGDHQILCGAMNRASVAMTIYRPRSTEDGFRQSPVMILSIENGIARRGDRFVDLAYVVLARPDGRILVRASESVGVPADLVRQAEALSWRMTCGSLEAQRTPGADPADPHRVWSGGTTSRREILADAIHRALCDGSTP